MDRGRTSELVGRDRELGLLTELAASAGAGAGKAVLLRGPAGIGKTALLRAALARIEPMTARSLHARCPEAGSGAYGAVRELFEPLRLVGEDGGIPRGAAENGRIGADGRSASEGGDSPDGGDSPGGSDSPDGSDAPADGDSSGDGGAPGGGFPGGGAENSDAAADLGARDLLSGAARHALPALEPGGMDDTTPSNTYAVLHGLHWLTAGLTADGMLVLTVDDVQWCDENSLRWLAFLLRRAEELPLLVLMTQRSGSTGPAAEVLGEIAEMPLCRTVDLTALDEPAVATLLTGLLGHPPEDSYTARLVRLTGGNPFLVDRVLGKLREHNGDREDPQVLEEHGRATVAASVLDRLAPHTLAVARAIAVLPGDQPELIAALAGVHRRACTTAVRELRRRDLVLEAGSGPEFVHDSIREAVLRGTPAGELERLRARAATLLNDAGRPAEEVAVPILLLPGDPEPWMLGVLREAATFAEHRGAPGMAARYLERVLSVDDSDVAVLSQAARVRVQGDPAGALRCLERGLELLDDPRRRVPLAVQYSLTSLTAQNSVRAFEIASQVLDELDAVLGPEPGRADQALRTLLESVVLISGIDEKATVDRVGRLFRNRPEPAGDTAEERQLLAVLSTLGALQAKPAAGPAEQARRVLKINDVDRGGWSLMGAAMTLYLADYNEIALEVLGTVVERAQSTGEAWTFCLATSVRAIVHHWTGDLAEALADGQTCYDVMVQESWHTKMTQPQIALAGALITQGEPVRAMELLDGITRARFQDFTMEYHWYLMTRARAHEALGDSERALEVLRHCGRSLREGVIANPLFAPWWYDAARILGDFGRLDEGREIAAEAAVAAERWGTPRARGMALTALGATSPGQEGVRLLTEAVEVLSDSPGRLEQAKAEYLLGRALLREGDAEGARERLRSSLDLSVLRRDRRQVSLSSAALLEAGGRLRRGTSSPADALSGSERRVAARAANGATNREIAESLFLTVRTVELHLTSAYRKLGVRGRAELSEALAGDPR